MSIESVLWGQGTNLRPREKGPRVWAVGVRGEVSNRTAFHWHRKVSLPDTCICFVLEEASVGVCRGKWL